MRQHPELPRRQATTKLLRVPSVDWAAIATGAKTELRTQGRYALMHHRVSPPWPVLGYMFPRWQTTPKTMLLIVEEAWSEPLGAISSESLRREGFPTLDEFRSYWRGRYRDGFKPLATVQVAQLRVLQAGDQRPMADRLLEHLYGRWL